MADKKSRAPKVRKIGSEIEFIDPEGQVAATFQNEHFAHRVLVEMFDVSEFQSAFPFGLQEAVPVERDGKRVKAVCDECGGENVKFDGWSVWDVDRQRYEHESEFDNGWCDDCEGETKPDFVRV